MRKWSAILVFVTALVSARASAEPPRTPAKLSGEALQQAPPNDTDDVLVVCADPAAMPRTSKAADGSARGVDLAVVELVCRRLGRKLEVHWCTNACYWRCLAEGRCDLVAGQPHGSGPSQGVAWSIPYAGSRFGLVVPRNAKGVRSLSDLRGKKIGVVAGTVAPEVDDATVVRFKSRESLLSRMLERGLDAAFVDADFSSWYLHEHDDLHLSQVAQFVSPQHWNVGFAVREGNDDLLAAVNRALTQALGTGEVAKAYTAEGVSYRAAFDDTGPRAPEYDTWKRIRDRGEMIVSMDPANLPYSSADPDRPGFDVEIARAVARELDVKLRLEWIDVQRETALGELLDRECDLAFGAVVDPNAVDDEQELARKVIYSRPYYGTGYLFVTRKDGPPVGSLAEIKGPKSRRLGAEAGSVADYQLRQRGYLRRLFRTQLAALKSLDDGGIDYAYLWANVGWTLHMTPEFALELTPNYVPEDHWNVAVAMRGGDGGLKDSVDVVVEKLVADGTVAGALARYHVPYFLPFAIEDGPGEGGPEPLKHDSDAKPVSRAGAAENTVAQDTAVKNAVAGRAGASLNEPPRMYRRQRSKLPYGGLARVRSAGTLVVGLDQNNLPFSTAHPEPAGMDYEIAGLLAENLGLSLEIYWGYSSHDSYPSKLATQKRCDLMLGIMPDDRFADRVLFSKPYHVAEFQLVVPAGADVDSLAGDPLAGDPLAGEQVAVEPGLAVRGLGQRDVRTYPSQAAVLEAVATGGARAGYVISTRGHWLASKHWPDKLDFVNLPERADRFAICAAVRKTDADLKEAIDRAFDDLASSGKLAEVFARWHIPYDAADAGGTAPK